MVNEATAPGTLPFISMGAPWITDEDVQELVKVLRSGRLREGPVCKQFEEEFAKKVGAKYAISVSSGTAALHVVYGSILKTGDEVIVPSFTFIATASMVKMAGGLPVFCDVDERTFTLDPSDAERKISPRTKAIAPVHLFGNSCDIPAIQKLADAHGLRVIWDAAQAHGTRYQGSDIGSFGDAVCYSFYPSKNMTTAEGGMIVTSDPEIFEMCKLLRNHGQTRKYEHAMLGFNYRLTEIQAALGRSQLRRLDEFVRRRRENAAFLTSRLKDAKGVVSPYVPPQVEHSFNQYTIVLSGTHAGSRREEFRGRLRQLGIDAAVHYPRPVHSQPAFAGSAKIDLPVSEDLSSRVISLPVHPQLSREELERVAEAVRIAAKQLI